METTLRNRVRYNAQSSQAIGRKAGQQRAAYNHAVAFCLAHPNTGKHELQHLLTLWRHQNPEYWNDTVACQRPKLFKGRQAVRQFHHADAAVLRECEKEIKLAKQATAQQPDSNKPRQAKPPRHGNRLERDIDPKKLFRSRMAPLTVIIEDNTRIRQLSTRRISVDGLTLELSKSIPINADLRAVHIRERASSIRQSRQRPLDRRAYDINLVIHVDDPPPKPLPGKASGYDSGAVHNLTDHDGNFYDCNITKLDALNQTIRDAQAHQQRLKHSSRQWRKEQAKIRKAHRDIANIKDNWEHHTAKAIAENNDVVIVEQLRHTDMRQGTRGTPENPSNNAAQKRGLNRTLSNARPGAMQQKLQRHCQKTGSNYLKVNPAGTSITCYSCGHRDRKNRKTQGLFLCLRCLIAVNADENAARNIRRRGLQLILLYLLMSTWSYVPNPKDRRVGIPSLDDSQRSVLTSLGGLWYQQYQGKLGERQALQRAQAVEPQPATITHG